MPAVSRLRKLRAWESSTWATREASLQGDSKAWLDRMQEALLSREAAVSSTPVQVLYCVPMRSC